MSFTLRQIVEQVKNDLETNLNTYISGTQLEGEDWFEDLSYHYDSPRIEDRFFMGVYLASPEGSVFQGTAQTGKVTVALDCILDDVRENSNLPTLYLSAVLDYLNHKRYGVSSNPTYGEVVRVDNDADVNAFSIAIEVIVYNMDYNQ